MSNDLNRWDGIGRLGADPEIKYMPNGNAVAKFSLACGRTWKDKNSGEKQESTEWVRCVAFGRLAEVIGEYCGKGKQVYVSGRLQTSKYDKDGQTHYSTEVVASEMQMLGGGAKREAESGGGGGEPYSPQTDEFGDDIPFITRNGVY